MSNTKPLLGCAWTLLGFNTLLLGFAAASFMQGPYSSHEQELWYRYGSFAFLVAGSILPGIVLFAARSSRIFVISSIVVMTVILFAFVNYAMLSGGGV